MPKTLPGRKRGGKNRGFFYRQERGWYAHDCGRMVPLRDSDGRPLKDPNLSQKLVRMAHARWLMDREEEEREQQKAAIVKLNVTLLEVCQATAVFGLAT